MPKIPNLARLASIVILAGFSRSKQLGCTSDLECESNFNSFYKCEEGHCGREDFQYRPIEIAGDVLIFLISALANAGGVGGGSMIIAIELIFFKFSLRDAIPASQITNLIGALTNVLGTFMTRHHTDTSALLINYPLAAIMVPAVMAGTLVGVVLSGIIPSLATAVLMELILFVTILILKSKLMTEMANEQDASKRALFQQPRAVANEINPEEHQVATESIALLDADWNKRSISQRDDGSLIADPFKEPTILDLFCRQVPNILILFLALAIVIFCALLRGGQRTPSILGIPSCSIGSWGVLLVTVLMLMAVVEGVRLLTENPIAYHKTLYPTISRRLNEFQSRLPVNVKIVLVSFISGILAGTLGIGGGTITNPLLMEIGFDPQTSTALSKLAVFFSASGTVSQLAIGGSIKMKHAYHFGFLGLCGSLVGNFVLAELVARYKRPSLVIWALLLILGISMLLYPVHLYDAVQHKTWAAVLKWGSICYHS